MAKLMENTFRATNIALSFEFAEAARRYGLDAVEVIDAAGTKPDAFMDHYPSAGVGGHCIPVDPYYLLEPLRAEGLHMPVIAASMEQVARRPGRFAQRALQVVEGKDDPRVLVVGATYKPGVADLRESAALEIVRALHMAGVHVDYHDPLAAFFEQDGVRFESVPPSAAGYDVAILTLVHPGQDLSWLHDCPVVIDGTYRTPVGARREVI
jgi:UDP-N-acetyl-D-glucosamine dehydrogenase